MPGMPERRRSPRVPFSEEVYVSASSGRELTCEGVDVSESGMLLCPPCGWGAAAGMPVRIRFTLPRAERAFTCTAVVVRDAGGGASLLRRLLALFRPPRAGWGLAFRQPGPELRRAIRTFVAAGHGQITEYEPA